MAYSNHGVALPVSVYLQGYFLVEADVLRSCAGGRIVEDHGTTPGLRMIDGAAMEGAAVMEDHRACRNGARPLLPKCDPSRARHVMHGPFRVAIHLKDTIPMGARHIEHAA